MYACAGHLSLTDHAATNLGDRTGLHGRHLALPLRVPLRAGDLREVDDLHADRLEYRERLDDDAGAPTHVPVTVAVTLEDPHLRRVRAMERWKSLDEQFDDIIGALSEGAAADRQLMIRLDVTVDIELDRQEKPAAPIVRRVAVGLPRIASLASSALRLRIDAEDTAFQYAPRHRVLEWFDVEMPALEPTAGGGRGSHDHRRRTLSCTAAEMVLTVTEPGELFEESFLSVDVDVELPGLLLSGTRARLFDATGREFADDLLVTRTTVHSATRVAVRDAFAERERASAQVLHFDEIVPEKRRVHDVVAALTALMFDVPAEADSHQADRDTTFWLVKAWSHHGPRESRLAILIRGRRTATHRKAQQTEGHEYSSRFASGDLTLYIHGTTWGDDRDLWQRVNELHTELRQRFRPLKAQR